MKFILVLFLVIIKVGGIVIMIISRIFAVFFFVIGFVGVFFEGKLVGKDLFIYLNTIRRLF